MKGIGICLCCAFFWTTFPCCAQLGPVEKQPLFPADYPVINPQFRKWPSPALDNTVSFVDAILKWPILKKKGAAYDIRLSQDAGFPDGKTITANNIPWTIYNPHRQLGKGVWFWQYRLHGEKWSELLQFRVTDDNERKFSPPVEQLLTGIPVSHPRVLINSKDRDLFVRQVNHSEDARAIIRNADKLLASTPPSEDEGKKRMKGKTEAENRKLALVASQKASEKIFHAVDPFCKAYILTGNEKYARKAITWAMAVARWDPRGVSHLNDFGDARCMLSMALVFDTFHERLSAAQRDSLLASIEVRANGFYNDWVNNIDAKVLSNHVWQYILHYFFQTAVAVYGESHDAANWIRYAYELWLARAPVLGGKDGAWAYGPVYFRLDMETLVDIPMMIREYTGFDFIGNTKWYAKNIGWLVYAFPPGSSCDGFGDDVEKLYSPGTPYLAYADALSKLTGDKTAAWYAGKIEKIEKVQLSDADWFRWFRMRHTRNLQRPDPVDISGLPNSTVFTGIGVAEMHSDLFDHNKDLMVALRSSPFGSYGHMLADQNTFNVLYGGERLFYMSGHKVAMQDPHRLGWYKATRGHNGILIDDKGQPFNVEAYGYIARFVAGRNISYAVGDASQAYNSETEKQQSGLTKFRRHLLFLQPNTIVIYDELEADHPAKWSWLIHSPYKIAIDTVNNQFRCSSTKASALTSLFSSQEMHWELSDTFAIPAVNWRGSKDEDGNLIEFKDDQWHLTAHSSNKSGKIRFLAVMTVDAGKAGLKAVPYHLNEKNELVINNWTIKAELDADKPALLEAYSNDGHTAFTSTADTIAVNKKNYKGNIEGSAKLVEFIDGKYVFSETGDTVPEVVKEIPFDTEN